MSNQNQRDNDNDSQSDHEVEVNYTKSAMIQIRECLKAMTETQKVNADSQKEFFTEMSKAFSTSKVIAATPTTYSGTKNESIQKWSFIVKQFFQCEEISEEKWPKLAITYLREGAHQYVQNQMHKGTEYDSLNELVSALKTAFESPYYQEQLRDELHALTQVKAGSVRNYNYQFRNIVDQIEKMEEFDKVYLYIQSLKEPTKRQVRRQHPTTLEAAMKSAINYDDSFSSTFSALAPTFQRRFPTSQSVSSFRPNNNFTSRQSSSTFQSYQQNKPLWKDNKTVSNFGKPYTPSTPPQQKKDYSNIKCYKCGKTGHYATICPQSSASSQATKN